MKNLNESPGPKVFTDKLIRPSKKNYNQHPQSFPWNRKGRTQTNSFCEASITFIPNLDSKEILNKIHTNQIQQHVKKIIYHDWIGLIPGIWEWLNICKSINVKHLTNRINDKNHMIFTKDTEKALGKDLICFYDKITIETRNRRNIPKHNKGYMW
jgi:hypothetical protein